MKISEFVRKISADGWRFSSHGKKHDVWTHPRKSGELLIPRHKGHELPTGTLKSLMDVARLGE